MPFNPALAVASRIDGIEWLPGFPRLTVAEAGASGVGGLIIVGSFGTDMGDLLDQVMRCGKNRF